MPLQQSNRGGVATTIAVTAAVGLLVANAMPHGPATAPEALIVMLVGFCTGLVAGAMVGSRWAVLLAVIVTILAIEVGRIQASGPTVDLPHLDNAFGIVALVLGRGFHGIVGLLPIIPGAAACRTLRAMLSKQSEGRPAPLSWRRLPIALLTLALLALALTIAMPATTPPIVDTHGDPVARSIAELATVTLGGQEQAILIRGYDQNKPVLLYLSGGPGQSSLPWPRLLFEELTRDVVLVAWDQRGAGKSYSALDPTDTLTVERVVADSTELTNYLRQRFDEEKIYVLGEPWGTTLGVLAAQQQPDLYHAIIGSGQMVSQRETDRRLYHDLLDYSARTEDEALAARMRAFGEPPYDDLYAYVFVMGYYDALYKPYTLPPAYLEKGAQARLGPWNVMGSEYNLVEKINVFRGFLDTAAILYPQLQEIDFRRDVPNLGTALYVLDGAAELDARRDLALEWFEMVDAPLKRLYTFENAAHATAFEQFEAFQQIMSQQILPDTYYTQ